MLGWYAWFSEAVSALSFGGRGHAGTSHLPPPVRPPVATIRKAYAQFLHLESANPSAWPTEPAPPPPNGHTDGMSTAHRIAHMLGFADG
jgi:hypothetical protein